MKALEKQYHDELKMELQRVPYSSSTSKQISVDETEAGEETLPDIQQIAEDAANMSKIIMPRKKRGLYEAIQVIPLNFLLGYMNFEFIFYFGVIEPSIIDFPLFRLANNESGIKSISSWNGGRSLKSLRNHRDELFRKFWDFVYGLVKQVERKNNSFVLR